MKDIALDMMKFIASTTSYGKAGAAGVGFQGSVSTRPPRNTHSI